MNIKPTLDRVLIERCKPEKESGGIIIPEAAQEKSTKGTVIAIGKLEKDYGFKVGDVVYFPKWGGTEINSEKTLIIIKAEEILGIE